MSVSSSERTEPRSWLTRHRRVLLIGCALLLVVLLSGAAGASWHFSSEVLVPNHSRLPSDATVDRVAPGEVALSRSADSLRPGVYGLEWRGGHAIVGRVLSSGGGAVTRRLQALSGRLTAGMRVAIDARVYEGDPERTLGLKFANVAVPDELGQMPAWLIAGRRDTWAIVVHGINGNRDDGLRIVPVLHRDGLPALLITYREDVGAPASPDKLHHMGLTEWRDLQASARYALAHGAKRLILVGYSMGGSIVSQFIEHSALARLVSGLVLDAPALDWQAILSFNATKMGLPSFMAEPVEWMIGERIHADWSGLDALLHPGDFHVPTLLFHGTADALVPISISDAFAGELPRWVTYYRVPNAGHTEAWNVDPGLYEQRISAFLDRAIGARSH